jgi:hypothetical protein
MPKKRRVSFIAVVLAIAALHAAPSYARDDWELWTELRWKKPLSKTTTLFGTVNGRFRRNMGEFYQQVDDLGVSCKAFSWLKIEPAYQWNFQERARTHDTVQEHRLYINLIPHTKVGPFQVEDRSRMEFRHVNGKDDWRYRNRSKVSMALGKGSSFEVKPYLADEIFYGFRAGEINRNRFLAGIERPIRKNLSVELFYVVQSDKTGKDWSEFHALGLATNVTF